MLTEPAKLQQSRDATSPRRGYLKPDPGPSFEREPWRTHGLEGGPDDLLSRPQPVEARHLAADEPPTAFPIGRGVVQLIVVIES